MINFNFSICRPYSMNFVSKDYFNYFRKIFTNKAIEINCGKNDDVISFSFRWDFRCDHAGIFVGIGIFCRYIDIHFYDKRHWNYKENRYVDKSRGVSLMDSEELIKLAEDVKEKAKLVTSTNKDFDNIKQKRSIAVLEHHHAVTKMKKFITEKLGVSL